MALWFLRHLHVFCPDQTAERNKLGLGPGKDRQIEQEMRSLGFIGGDRQMALKLPHHAGDHLEPQAGLRLVDVESERKADTLVGHLDMKMSVDFPRAEDEVPGARHPDHAWQGVERTEIGRAHV